MNIKFLINFDDYVYKFNLKDKQIKFKYEHSLRVMKIANKIAIKSKFNKVDCHICKIAGLLHDYGRFSQWKNYQTYSDINSIDHGDLGVKLLFDDNEIINFETDKTLYDEIYDAIKYHNKAYIDDNLSDHNKRICRVIRDADKLDIFYLFSIDKNLILECDDEITDEIKKKFYNHEVISYKNVRNLNDKVLLYLAFVFDLNYTYSFKQLKKNKLIEKIYKDIEYKEIFKEYFDYINKYIDERNEIK